MPLSPQALQAITELCDRLSERMAVLFTGAGINAGLKNSDGVDFPLGQQLADFIARDILETPALSTTLDEAAEMAQQRVGPQQLNLYLYRLLTSFSPGACHLAAVQLPWDVIYTTNYDIVLETAALAPSLSPAGTIKPVLSVYDDLAAFTESDILYHKLHGTIDQANTDRGHLVLTKADYRHYDKFRKPLFKRLKKDLLNRMFLFVGYALRDSNFRQILDDCRDCMGACNLLRCL